MINKAIALIPARGGSKGIPKKNLQLVGDVPLLVRTIRTAQQAGIQEIFVSTEDSEIANVAKRSGAKIIVRPKELATDESSTNSVLEHSHDYLVREGFDDLSPFFLLQCTSPFLKASTLIEMLGISNFEKPFIRMTTYQWHGVLWEHADKEMIPYGHSLSNRARRQDAPERVLETGAAYLSRLIDISSSQRRLARANYGFMTTFVESLQIDSLEDLEVCKSLVRAY